MEKRILIMLMITFVLSGCQQKVDFSFEDWDANNDGQIDLPEFTYTFKNNYYDDWDNDNDQYLDDEDFFKVVYRIWDIDGDKLLDEDEWVMGYRDFHGNTVQVDYKDINIDGNDHVVYKEYMKGMNDADFYSAWDKNNDGNLSDNELATGIFHTWDTNNNGLIEEKEYQKFDAKYEDI